MNQSHFTGQIQRLCDTYGKAHFGNERARLIWEIVAFMGDEAFTKIIDALIRTQRQAPLPAEFDGPARLERERTWQKQKTQNGADAKSFWAGDSLHDDERREVVKTIRARICGTVPDHEWDKFIESLEYSARQVTIP